MRHRFPLWAKILAWFFGNLALLAVAAWLLVEHQLRGGLDSLLAGSAGDRIRAVAALVAQELMAGPRSGWDAVLAKYERTYGVRFAMFNDRAEQIAGAPLAVPRDLRGHLERVHPPRPGPRGGRPGPPPSGGPPPRPGEPPPGPSGEFRGPGAGAPPERRQPDIAAFIRTDNPRQYWTLLRAPLARPTPDGRLVLAIVSDTLSAGGLLFDPAPLLWAGAGALALSVIFWLPLVRGISRSIAGMRDATAQIAEGRFEVRVSDRRRDELGALGASINTMSERLAGLVHGQRRFVSDVAHELCAPLSRLQLALGILEDRAAEPERERLRDVREEVDHMAQLVNELLSFSRDALGSASKALSPVAVCEILKRAVRREAAGAQVEIACDRSLGAEANAELLDRALGNLLRNAVRYASEAGPIRVSAAGHEGMVVITVADGGPGVPEEALPHLFDPFFRVDTARTRETGGVGLGLTIAKTCVEACRGTITARQAQPGGLEVTIRLPEAVGFS